MKNKGGEIKMDTSGLRLLLTFALGAIEEGTCCGKGVDFAAGFAKKVRRYLKGETVLAKEIIGEFPAQLRTAWPILKFLAKDAKDGGSPLSKATVSLFVFKKHNEDNGAKGVGEFCNVTAGIVQSFDVKNANVSVRGIRTGKKYTVTCIKFPAGLKVGDMVAFHRGYFISKISKKIAETLK